MSQIDDDKQLLLELQKQFVSLPSPKYESFEKISDDGNFSQMSDSVIRVGSDPDDSDNSEISRSKSKEKNKRWQYCCFKCTKSDKGSVRPKTCVCIVPASQRRIQIGEQGCLTCGCNGCSIEDLKKKKRKIKRKKSTSESSSSDSKDFKTVNGCCKKCMKAFSKKGKEAKSCLCQVPRAVRKKPLPAHGCQYCGCHGCNPEDRKKDKGKRSSPMSPVSEDINEMNLNNFHRAPLYMQLMEQNINPAIIGIGIPQRTYSYLYGRDQGQR